MHKAGESLAYSPLTLRVHYKVSWLAVTTDRLRPGRMRVTNGGA